MKPEEQVRADFEAWFSKQANHADTKWFEKQMALDAYRAAYAQARREALEEAAECLRLHAIGHFTLLEAERALEQLIKDQP